jgi:hypothetical protein
MDDDSDYGEIEGADDSYGGLTGSESPDHTWTATFLSVGPVEAFPLIEVGRVEAVPL